MKKQGSKVNPPSIQIGRVVSPAPLVIQIGDLPIDADNILIADYLLSTRLKLNDKLAVLPTFDRQLYIVLAKLVKV